VPDKALEDRAKSDKRLEPQIERLRQEVADVERAQNMTQEQELAAVAVEGGANNARGMATRGPCCPSALSFAVPIRILHINRNRVWKMTVRPS
jgi:uncharacterized protein (DUF3084 family)